MNYDDPLEKLRNLPRVEARPGFTRSVLQRLDAAPPPLAQRQPRMTVAVAVGLILIVFGLQLHQQRAQRAAIARDIAQMKQELSSIREQTPEPVLLVGGTEDMDYVIDLRPARERAVPAGLESTFY